MPLYRDPVLNQQSTPGTAQTGNFNITGTGNMPNLSLIEALGSELTTNGSFTGSATGWTLGAAWAYNANAVDKNADGTSTLTPNPALSIVAGTIYKLVFTISNWTVGTVTPNLGGIGGDAYGANGTFTEYFTAGTTGNLSFTPSNTARFTIDDISVKAATDSVSDTTGPVQLTKTLNSATGNQEAFALNYITNKATSGNDTGLLVNMIDTASPGTSNLINLLVNGASQFSVAQNGLTNTTGTLSIAAGGGNLSASNFLGSSSNGSAITGRTSFTGDGQASIFLCASQSGGVPTNQIFTNTANATSRVAILPTYNQTSGTAANTDLLINRTETAVGSGAQLLADFQVGSASKFKVDNTGVVTVNTAVVHTASAGGTTSGELWNDSTQKNIAQYTSGIKQVMGGTIFTATADKTVANTVTETSLFGTGIGTLTLPANFFVAGKSIRIKMWGFFGTTVNPTMNMTLKFGSTTIATTGAQTMGANAANKLQENELIVTCRTTGATGTVMAQGRCICNTTIMGWLNSTTVTIDTTASQVIDVTNIWGTADPLNTVTITNSIVEVLN